LQNFHNNLQNYDHPSNSYQSSCVVIQYLANSYKYGNYTTPASIFIHVAFRLIRFAPNYFDFPLPYTHSLYARKGFRSFQTWVTSLVQILNIYLIRISVHNGSEWDIA